MFKVKTKYSLFKIFLVSAVVFNVALPKGGFAISEIPITWGYIILFTLIFLASIKLLLVKKLDLNNVKSYLLTLPFSIYFIIYLFYVDKYSLSGGYLISAIISFVLFPFVFIVLFEQWNKSILINFDFFHKLLLRSVLFLSIFGLILFIFKIKTGADIEIPYITINAKDVGQLANKYNNRGDGIFKLISTYNNGNIFGLCMFFLLPFTKNHKWHKVLLKAVMILTISRTVWAGLIIYEMISYRKYIIKIIMGALLTFVMLILALVFILDKDISYLFDPTLNGRLDGHFFEKIHIFFYDKDFSGIAEMTYKSILEQMGIVGVILFIIHVFSPLIINYIHKLSKDQNEYLEQLRVGILTYLIVAFIDGAYLFIPVGLFLWFFNSLILTKEAV